MAIQTDYYHILEVHYSASDKEITDAFRRLTKIYHPDRHSNSKQSHKKYMQIVEAYNILSDKNRRLQYDMETKGKSISDNDSFQNIVNNDQFLRDSYRKPHIDYFLNSKEQKGDYFCEVGLSYSNAHEYDRAVHYFDMAIELYPRKSAYWINKGETLLKMNLDNDALDCFEKSLRIEPGNIKAINDRNHVLNKLKGLRI